MSRYIDADALRHLVLYFADASNLNGNHEQTKAYNHCLCMIDDRKTADVREVKRREWGAHGECPFCGYLRQWEEDNYCGNCGADMRKEVEE